MDLSDFNSVGCLARLAFHLLIITLSSFSAPQDVMGFNSAALQFLQRELESKEDVMFFAEATGKLSEKRGRRRKRERAVLTIA